MNIHVRHMDEATVQALKQRAARNGRSAEAEYRAILNDQPYTPPQKPAETTEAAPVC